MIFQEMLSQVYGRLAEAGIEEPQIEAEMLVRSAANISRENLYAELSDAFPPEAEAVIKQMLERRLKREPLAYILNLREFYGMELYVDERVLIPRPETEQLVEDVIDFACSDMGFLTGETLRIVDIGTGSGAIAVAIAANVRQSTVKAVDISTDALEVASINCEGHKLEARIELLHGDLLAPVKGPVDLIVANLPYVAESEWESLQPEITKFEPKHALVAVDGGLALLKRLLQEVAVLRPQPRGVILEFGAGQAPAVLKLAQQILPKAKTEIHKDLADIERSIVIRL